MDSEEIRHDCAFCEKSFPWMSSLTRHVSKDHNETKKAKSKASKKIQSKLENYAILEPCGMISEELENGSFELKQGFVATNGTIPQNDGDNIIIKSQETQNFSEYLLPHGWKKIGRKRKKIDDRSVEEWVEFVKDQKEEQNKGYFFEVDLEYPKELHDLHDTFPCAPEHVEIKEEDGIIEISDEEEMSGSNSLNESINIRSETKGKN